MRFPLRISASYLLFLLSQLLSQPAVAQKVSQAEDELLSKLQGYSQAYAYYRQAKFADAVQELQNDLLKHENDAQFFNLLGVLQLKQKNYTAAAASFERAVLIEPNNAGSWMDLAVATMEAGNYASAASYFEYIEANFKPPEKLQKLIDGYKKRLQQASMSLKNWQNLMEFQIGHDTNANSGLQSAFIPVTFDSGRVDLPLDPAFKARADNYAQLGIGTRYRRAIDTQAYEFGFSAKHRGYKHEHAFSSTDFSTNLGMQQANRLGMLSINAYGDFTSLGGKGLLHNVRLSGSIERPLKSCRYGFGAEVEWRRYVSLSGLNANISWGQIAAACEQVIVGKTLQFAIIGRYGLDQPIASRVGGTTHRKEWVFQVGSKILPKLQADLSLNFSNAYDAEGYSALLENNATRNLYRRNYRFQLSTPLDSDLDLVLRFDRNTINSNLLLFVQSGSSFNLGLQRRF